MLLGEKIAAFMISYEITKDQVSHLYGLRIQTKNCSDNSIEKLYEIPDITAEKNRITSLINRIQENFVLSDHLFEIVEDFLEYPEYFEN